MQQAGVDYAATQIGVNAVYEDAVVQQRTAENQTQAAVQLDTTANEVTLEQLNGNLLATGRVAAMHDTQYMYILMKGTCRNSHSAHQHIALYPFMQIY